MNTQTTNHRRLQLDSSRLLHSPEPGDPNPPHSKYAASIAAKPAPVAKSWAHFVAGGYVSFSSSYTMAVNTFLVELEA
jgi:solute carrier family 25, member 33/36